MFQFKNFAKSELASQLLIAGTSLSVQTGEGARFPDTGSTNIFRGVIWGSTYATPFDDSTREVVEAYRSSGDTFTIVRAQEGTSAKQWEIGDNFMLTATAATLEDLRANNSIISNETPSGDLDGVDLTYALANAPVVGSLALYLNGQRLTYTEDYTLSGSTITFVTAPVSTDLIRADYLLAGAGTWNADTLDGSHLTDILSALNPIGTIREFNVSTNPATLLGFGTWSAYGTGRVTVAIDAGQTEFDTVDETGGAKTVTLTAAQSGLPAHPHTVGIKLSSTEAAGYGLKVSPDGFTDRAMVSGDSTSTSTVSAANASSAHTNLQPYIVVYRWVRVS